MNKGRPKKVLPQNQEETWDSQLQEREEEESLPQKQELNKDSAIASPAQPPQMSETEYWRYHLTLLKIIGEELNLLNSNLGTIALRIRDSNKLFAESQGWEVEEEGAHAG